MKKFFTSIILLFSLTSVFALGDFSSSTLSLGIAFPYINQDLKIDDPESINMTGTGFKLNYRHVNEGFTYGLFLDTDIFIPASKTINYSADYSTTVNMTNYSYFFGIDLLAGVYKVLFISDGLNVPGGIGIHMDGYTSKIEKNDYDIKETIYTLGVGAWVNCEINVSKTFGVFGGLKATYDFYGKTKFTQYSTTSKSGRISAWSLVPAVGVAFHL